jgi:hypothetical protein
MIFELSFRRHTGNHSGLQNIRLKQKKTCEPIAQGIGGIWVNIFGIFLANLVQAVKKAAEFHAENDGGKQWESSAAN